MASLPAPVAAYAESTSGDHAQCGPLSAQAVVHAMGVNVPVPTMDNAWAEELAGWINGIGFGVHAAVFTAGQMPSTLAAQHIPQNHYLIVGVNCTSNAEPTTTVTGLRHWLPVYSTALDALNVWEPKYEKISDAEHSTLMNTVVVWRDGWPAPPPPVLTTGDDSMAASFVTADGGQQVQFWADATTGHIWETWYTTHDGQWHGPVDCTAEWKAVPASGGLSANGDEQNTQYVYWTGTDKHRYEMWYTGKWNGPLHVPGT